MKTVVESDIRPVRATVAVPGDKSISHRAFLLNALGVGDCRIRGALDSEDIAASRRLIEQLGRRVHRDGPDWVVRGGHLVEPADVLDCGNSGTTMRLGAGVAAHAPGLRVLTGDASLRGRPMRRIVEPLRAVGVDVDGRMGGTRAPLLLRGAPRRPGTFSLSIASAQVKSACLLAGRAHGVVVEEPRRSRDHTERQLLAMGARLTSSGNRTTLVPGHWDAVDVEVPGDLSSAAFWLVAAAVRPGSRVVLPGIGLNPTRIGILRALTAMGAVVERSDVRTDGEPRGTVVLTSPDGLRGTRIGGDLALACIDELPILAIAAALAAGETVIADAAELRVKESDRIARVVAGLRAMGIEAEERPDGMVIQGGRFHGDRVVIDADGDHRIAMAFAIAGRNHPSGVGLLHADSVRTSYPRFFETLAVLSEEER